MEAATKIYRDLIFPHGFQDAPESEFSFAKSMLDASVDCIKVISPDGNLLAMNRAGCLALGVPEDSDFGMPWLPLLPEGVQAAGQAAIEAVRRGQSARFPGKSEAVGETRYWDNLLTPISDDQGRVQVILCVSRDVTAKTLLEAELENALTREKLLAQEMRHRIKNVFAVLSGLISLSEREAAATDAAATDAADGGALALLREKLASFARASDIVFEPSEIGGADRDHVDVGLVVSSVLRPFASKCQIAGGQCLVPSRDVTALVLFLHELATNSVKYGAFGADDGTVRLTWEADGSELRLTWAESGGAPMQEAPRKLGFGTDMVERMARAAGGKVAKSWSTQGLVATLFLPKA